MKSMLSVDQARKVDPSLESVPDDELERVLGALYGLAGVMFDDWVENGGYLGIGGGSKSPAWGLHRVEDEGKITP